MRFSYLLVGLLLASCQSSAPESVAVLSTGSQKLFTLLDSSGVDFNNFLVEDYINHGLDKIYIYNGGGVAVGDLDGDGLADLVFTGNQVDNKIYKNLGGLKFRDITEGSGLDLENGGWCSGVTMVDINQDGHLDLYICRSYWEDPKLRSNQLFINKGDATFTEQSAAYGLDNQDFSIQGTFFDYDLDGDLDMYLLNQPDETHIEFEGLVELLKKPLRMKTSDQFYRNDGDGRFTNITKEAGVLNYGYGLSAAIADFNQDGYPDVYVANDFIQNDFYYENNGDGTFSERLRDYFDHVTFYAMGSSVSDFNNDGLLDLFVLDMMAEDNYRQKTSMASMNVEGFWALINSGFHYQYMRNTLQVNNGRGSFSEIGQLAGISSTDWSWAALFADVDNDGWKDLFVSNGYRRDIRNVDANKKLDKITEQNKGMFLQEELQEMLDLFPVQKMSNYLFWNTSGYSFENRSVEFGLNEPSFSHGAAYCDLDLDGDLDLVVNNLMDPAFVYRNNSREISQNHYLRVNLNGLKGNLRGIGAKVTIHTGDQMQFQEMQVVSGYQSSVEDILHFGLGNVKMVDRLTVVWMDGRGETLENVPVNQVLTLEQVNARKLTPDKTTPETTFTELETTLDFTHVEQAYNDYEIEVLVPHKMNEFGPKLASGDVNGDGLEDLFVGGGAGQTGALFIQTKTGFQKTAWAHDPDSEDMGAAFFDADGDKDLDLYIVSGSNEFGEDAPELADRLYLNDGNGIFTKSKNIPEILSAGSCVVPGDFDADGDQDLFVGGRGIPGKYPQASQSYILKNEGGKFTDVTATVAPGLSEIGMVSSAVWTDVDGDDAMDLMLVGEWMPITYLKNVGGVFNRQEPEGLALSNGWWNKIVAADIDGDGDMDYIAGNFGENSKFRVSEDEPLHLYTHDFDNSGTQDIVLGYYNQGLCYPVRGRQCSSEQMPNIKEKFPSYDAFGKASLVDVYGEKLNEAVHHQAFNFASSYIENQGGGKFKIHPLPKRAQFSSVFGLIPFDFDSDGSLDILLAGNFFPLEIETGRNDAGTGLLLMGDGKGHFKPVSLAESGFYAPGDVREILMIKGFEANTIIVANNKDKLQLFLTNTPPAL